MISFSGQAVCSRAGNAYRLPALIVLGGNTDKAVVDITGNQIVDKISKMNFTGNIIPMSWFQNIKLKNGKPDTVAIIILSDIIYWYRAKEAREESTGMVVGQKTKFKADMLQKSYQALADQFGFTKRQVQDAVKRLRDGGIIRTELRIITAIGGMKLSNVLYMEPIPDAIERITYNTNAKKQPSYNVAEGVSRYNVTPPTVDEGTYTEITTETTTKTKNNNGIFTSENPCHYLEFDFADKDKRQIVNYYMQRYRECTDRTHPRLKPSQWQRVSEGLEGCYNEQMDIYFDLVDVDGWKRMIDKHFMTDYKNCDYNILHFITDGVKVRRMYEEAY